MSAGFEYLELIVWSNKILPPSIHLICVHRTSAFLSLEAILKTTKPLNKTIYFQEYCCTVMDSYRHMQHNNILLLLPVLLNVLGC